MRALAAEAAQLIDRLDRLVRSGETGHGLNPAQWEALRYLARANRFSRTPAALADYLGSTRGTVSQTLIVLEQKGHIARGQSARDKRSVDLDLTEKGRTILSGSSGNRVGDFGTSERWKHACEDLEPQIFLVA